MPQIEFPQLTDVGAARMRGKVALVTGADRGVGQAQAIRLAAEGADIALLVFETDAEETVGRAEEFGSNVSVHRVDNRDLEAVEAAVADAVGEHGSLDVVCASAGRNGGNAPMWELDPQTFREVFDTNVYGTWHTLRATVPYLLRGGPGGSIVVMGSTVESRGVPTASHYCASKHAVLGLMRSLAAELGPYGIRVNGIVPTNVDTVMFHNAETYALLVPSEAEPSRDRIAGAAQDWHQLPVGWVQPEDIAAATAFLASAEARFVTGSSLRVDAGLLNKWPG